MSAVIVFFTFFSYGPSAVTREAYFISTVLFAWLVCCRSVRVRPRSVSRGFTRSRTRRCRGPVYPCRSHHGHCSVTGTERRQSRYGPVTVFLRFERMAISFHLFRFRMFLGPLGLTRVARPMTNRTTRHVTRYHPRRRYRQIGLRVMGNYGRHLTTRQRSDNNRRHNRRCSRVSG